MLIWVCEVSICTVISSVELNAKVWSPAFSMSLDYLHSIEMHSEKSVFIGDECSCLMAVGFKFWKHRITRQLLFYFHHSWEFDLHLLWTIISSTNKGSLTLKCCFTVYMKMQPHTTTWEWMTDRGQHTLKETLDSMLRRNLSWLVKKKEFRQCQPNEQLRNKENLSCPLLACFPILCHFPTFGM